MRFIASIPGLLAVSNALAFKRQGDCDNPTTRKEWRDISDSDKETYIDAVKCLQTVDSRLRSTSTGSLYDDFAYIHRSLDEDIHFVAVFLPWHRWFIHLYEQALHDECNYTGTLPYWDWTLDYEDPGDAPVFDPDTGFGGDGEEDHCVTDGPFADWQVTTPDDHCLKRNFDLSIIEEFAAPSAIEEVMDNDDYESFRPALENGPHRSGHDGIAGDISTNFSPNDPIFFLHHANVDRLWWKWQTESHDRRTDYSGNRYQDDSDSEASPDDETPMLSDFVDDIPNVSEILWVQSGLFCYTY